MQFTLQKCKHNHIVKEAQTILPEILFKHKLLQNRLSILLINNRIQYTRISTMDKFQNYIDPLSKKLKELEKEGFNDQFKFIEEQGLQSTTSKNTYQAKDLRITNEYRFEGESNPSDMSILYAIQASDGTKGTLVDAYGTYANDELEQFLRSVEDNSNENL